MRNIAYSACICFVLSASLAQAQFITGRAVTSVYGWERRDSIGSTSQHLRGYEYLQLDAGMGMVTFHTSLQASTDFVNALDSDPGIRLYNAYIRVANIAHIAEVRLGRMPVFGGVNYGSIDGAQVRLRPTRNVELILYGGGLTPASQKTDFFHNVEDNWQTGAHAVYAVLPEVRLGLSYMNRHRESLPFVGYRANERQEFVPTTIDYGSRANQYGSFDVSYLKNAWWMYGRVDYDFNFEHLSRAELTMNYQALDNLGLNLGMQHREPTIAWNSYFALLEAKANDEYSFGADYDIHPRLRLHGSVSTVTYDENDYQYRVTLGASNSYASVMYTRDFSVDGGLDGVNAFVSYPLVQGKVVPSAGVTYSSYALSETMDRTTALALVGGVMVRPWPMLSFDAQAQYFRNNLYESDVRGFLRINYWFAHSMAQSEEGQK